MSESPQRGVVDTPESNVEDWVARVHALCAEELSGIAANGRVVDVCSGEGGVARGLLPDHRIVGVEYSGERCRRCGGRVRPSGDKVVGTSEIFRPFSEDFTTISLANSIPVFLKPSWQIASRENPRKPQ